MKKSINFKKQLAFISSLALIAGSAVYMPANVSEIIGISKAVSVNAEGDTTEISAIAAKPGFTYDGAKGDFALGDETTGEGTAEKPYVYVVSGINAEYGSTMNYTFSSANGLSAVSGSKGTVTFDSTDGSATTGVFKAYDSGKTDYVYYQVKFIQTAEISTDCYNGNVTNAAAFTYNDNSEAKDFELTFGPSKKLELIDGKYVKNYDAVVPATVKAKSKITVALSGFKNGYGIGTTDNKFDVTLDENGNASTILKISSTWEDQNVVEYVKVNFALESSFDKTSDTLTFGGVDSKSYSTNYITDGNKYVKVYTVRDAIADGDKTTISGVTTLTEADGTTDIADHALTFKDGVSQVAIVNKGAEAPYEYIKVAYNPTYTLTFYDTVYDDDGMEAETDTVLATMEETVGGKYVFPENPTKEGYTFAGWHIKGGSTIYPGETVEQEDGIVAYAEWTPILYTIKLDANGGTAATSIEKLEEDWNISSYGISVQVSGVPYNTPGKLSAATGLVSRVGYELIGFSTDKNATAPDENLSFLDKDGKLNSGAAVNLGKLTSEAGSTVTLYAVWRAESKSLKFDEKSDGIISVFDTIIGGPVEGMKIEGDQQLSDIKVAVDSKIGELPKATLKGYTFKGWCYDIVSDDSAGSDVSDGRTIKSVTMITPDTIFTNELAEKTIYPYFEANIYNVNYEDITITDENAPSTFFFTPFGECAFWYDYMKDSSTTGYIESEKSGYNLLGYTVNGIVKDATQKEEVVSKYFTLAEIEGLLKSEDPTPLTYKTSDGKTATFSVDTADLTIKAIWVIDETSGLINVDYDGAIVTYTNPETGNTIKVKPTSSTYSKFPTSLTGKPGDRIAYDCVIDGKDGPDNITFTDYGFDVDDVECTLSKDGYVFAGWFTKDADGKEVAFTNTKFTAGVTNIYAKWEAESKLTAPTNVKVSKDGTVSWTAAEGASYYRVYKKYGKTTKNAKVAATATSYKFQNLTEGVEHEIYVVAFDENGNSLQSESVMFTPEKKAVLTAPTNVKVDANGNVTWTAAENAAYYKVSKVVNGKTSTGKQVTDTKYTFQYLAKGQKHEIYVTAFDKDGNSIKSESVTVTPMAAPANVKVSDDGTVTWTKSEGAAYYRVYKKYGKTTKNAKVAATATSYTFQNLTEGVEHEIYVIAFDNDGNQYKSESVKFTPAKKATLTAPTNVKVDADGNVTWTAAENAAYYKVSKVVGGKTYTGKQVTDTKYTFISFNPGQSKTVYVTAFDKDGNSLKSEAVTVKAVENIKVTAKGVVTFDKVDGAAYYRVYKEYNGVTKNAKTTSSPYTFQSFTKGVKHDVYVKAYNASGKEIASSKTVTVTAE